MKTLTISMLLMVFTAFGQDESLDLDLAGWVALAFDNSPDLAGPSADLISARASVTSSESFLWPHLSFSSSAGHSWSSVPLPGGGWEDTDNSSYSMSLSLSQELLANGGSSWLQLSGSRHAMTASEIDLQQARLDLTLDVIEAYYGVIESIELLASAERALDRSTEQMSRTRSLYELGASTNLEMIQAEVQQSRDSLTLLQRSQAVRDSYAMLYRTVGVVDCRHRVQTGAVLQPVSVTTAMDYELDLEMNNSLTSARERLKETELSYEASRRSYIPSLNLSGSWGWSNDEPDFDDFQYHDSWSVSLRLSWTLFDGFSRESIIQSHRAAVIRQEAAVEALENTVYTNLEIYRNSLVNSIESWELSLEVLNQAREQLRLSEMSYSLGSISLLDLLDAQSGVADAEASAVSARSDCLIAEARLLVLIGQPPRTGE